MGMHEKMSAIRAEEQVASAEIQKAEEEIKREQGRRYQQELPETLRIQRALFEELQAMGIISMIEEMTVPDKVVRLQTPEEKLETEKKTRKRFDELKTGIVETITAKQIMEDLRRNEWGPQVLLPEQKDDGSVEPTLRILVQDNPLKRGRGNRKTVNISYSEKKILTIEGEDVTFQDQVTQNHADKDTIDTIETALAHAFLKPQFPKISPRNFDMNTPIGIAR